MIVFGWTHRGLTSGFSSAQARSVGVYSHEPSSLFHHRVLFDLSVSVMIHW